MQLDTVEELIEDLRQGKMIVLMDDEDRENEGDLIMIAELVRPEDINFMATHARGLICLPLTAERCAQLDLPLMVRDNKSSFATNFTVSIEASTGVTTGISAADRARTIHAAVRPEAKATDIVQPGHVFPFNAPPCCVFSFAGQTESACDLSNLACFSPSGLLVDLMYDDCTISSRTALE